MKKILLSVLVIASTSLSMYAQNPVPNPGFETWTGGNPDNWFTTNIATMVTTITAATPSHSGSYAAKGQAGIFQGQVFSPVLASMDLTATGFPVTQLYSDLNLWYRTNLVQGDIFTVAVIFMDAAQGTLAVGATDITANASSFTQLSIPVTFVQAGTPAYAIITITLADANGNEPNLASWFEVDDLSLTGTLSSIPTLNSSAEPVSIYPNPASETLTVKVNDPSLSKLVIFNLQGKKVAEVQTGSTGVSQQHQIDLRTYSNGFYFMRAIGTTTTTIPFIVSH